MCTITPREQLIAALRLQAPPDGLVPHYEFQFQKELELTGAAYHYRSPEFRTLPAVERHARLRDDAARYLAVAERLGHCGIRIHFGDIDGEMVSDELVLIRHLKDLANDRFFIQGTLRCSTFEIPLSDGFEDLVCMLHTDPEAVEELCREKLKRGIAWAQQFADAGCDGVDEFADYCLNTGPLMAPRMFSRFITPYLAELVGAVKAMGLYFLKHTDGDVMPIMEELISCRPDALQSIEPVGATNLDNMKARYGDRVCLMGNVDCATLVSGPEARIQELTQHAIDVGAPGGGFVLMSSNAIHFGVPLTHYLAMHRTWQMSGRSAVTMKE